MTLDSVMRCLSCLGPLLALLSACDPLRPNSLPVHVYPTFADDDGDHEPKFDTLPEIELDPMECIECSLSVASQQSGVLAITGDHVFATAELAGEIVYALGTYTGGRFIASADSALPFHEITDCPLHAWLAGSVEPPEILMFGWTELDGPVTHDVDATVAGVHLPSEYVGDPGRLAQDFDIVVYLEASAQYDGGDAPSDAEIQTLLDYLGVHGGGLYIVGEFANPEWHAYLDEADLVSINRLLAPLGVEHARVSLAWGEVTGDIEFSCFPAPVG